MKPAFGTRRQLAAFVIALFVFVALFVRWRSAPVAPEIPAGVSATAGGRAADGLVAGDRPAGAAKPRPRGERTPSIDDISFLDPKDFDPPAPRPGSLGSRNPFDLRAPTPVPPPPPTPAPPPPPAPGSALYIGPMPPPPPTPTPMPPPINFKFIGTFGPKDHPLAVLILNDQLVNARAGDVVFEQFILRRIGFESVDIGFVGRDPADVRRIPIAPQ
jgi:hypothetical protein